MKFEEKEKVTVVNCSDRFNGRTGQIEKIHNDLDIETVYTIVYDEFDGKGMFPESQLELLR